MAGEDNIKLAVRHIEKAIFEKNADIKRLMTDLDRQRKDLEHDIDKLSQDIARNSALLSRPGVSDNRKSMLMRTLVLTKGEVEERRKQLNQLHDSMKGHIRTVEQEVGALNSQMQHLQQLR